MKRWSRASGDRNAVGVIKTDADVAEGVRALIGVCPHMAEACRVAGHPPLRRWKDRFAGLARIIVGQQLSTASASAIFGRLAAAVDPLEAGRFLQASDATLRGCGLSAGKVATLRAAAEAVETGALDLSGLHGQEAGAVHEALTAVKGIGPWTADIYLLFCRGDADAFAPGDLALQVGVQMLFRQKRRPSAAEIEAIAERWRPWRGVAARLIWAYYGAVKAGAAETAPTTARSGGRQKTRAKAPPKPPRKSRRKPPGRGGRSGE